MEQVEEEAELVAFEVAVAEEEGAEEEDQHQ